MDEYNTIQLARMAECAAPDEDDKNSPGSPGARFLRRVADDLGDALERTMNGGDVNDVVHDVADSSVPIYTHTIWGTFTDLAAYQEDVGELAEPETDMTKQAQIALYMIAERLLHELISEAETLPCGCPSRIVEDEGHQEGCDEHED